MGRGLLPPRSNELSCRSPLTAVTFNLYHSCLPVAFLGECLGKEEKSCNLASLPSQMGEKRWAGYSACYSATSGERGLEEEEEELPVVQIWEEGE